MGDISNPSIISRHSGPPSSQAHQVPYASLRIRSGKNLAKGRNRAQDLGVFQPRPLHAHQEVVDAKQLVVALNFLPYEGLVANDEAVLDELLERLIEGLRTFGLLVEPPGRIGAILVFQRSLALFESLGPGRSDIAFARDRHIGRKRLFHALEGVAIEFLL